MVLIIISHREYFSIIVVDCLLLKLVSFKPERIQEDKDLWNYKYLLSWMRIIRGLQ